MKIPDWYNEIEEPLKELIFILRNNGFNTFCSCGHYPEPYIQIEWYSDDQVTRLWNLLSEHHYVNWEIHTYWRYDGRRRSMHVVFYPQEKGDKEALVPISSIRSFQ